MKMFPLKLSHGTLAASLMSCIRRALFPRARWTSCPLDLCCKSLCPFLLTAGLLAPLTLTYRVTVLSKGKTSGPVLFSRNQMQATDAIFHFLVVTLKIKIIHEINLNNLFYLTQYIRPTSNPYKKLLRSF